MEYISLMISMEKKCLNILRKRIAKLSTKSLGENVKVESDLSIYLFNKNNFNICIRFDTSEFARKADLANLESDVD